MFFPIAPDASESQRWLPITNAAGSSIPAFGLVRVTGGGKTTPYTVAQPNAGGGYVWISGGVADLPDTFTGVATADGPAWAYYDSGDGTPALGETWGAGNASWKLRKNNAGFLVVGDPDTTLEIVPVVRNPLTRDLALGTGLPLTTGVTGTLPSANGGTGANNSPYTITMGGSISTGGSFTLTGAYTLGVTLTANTSLTLPTSGTVLSTTSDGVPIWRLHGTVTHADLAGVMATSGLVTMTALPARTAFHGGELRVRVAADGGGVTLLQVTIEVESNTFPGSANGQTVDSTIAWFDNVAAIGSWAFDWAGTATVKMSFFDCDVNLDALTAGTWDLYLCTATIPSP